MADFILGRIKFQFQGPWTTGTAYIKDDVVKFGGQSYVCLINHTAAANFYTDLNAATPLWSVMTSGTDYKGDWTSGNGTSTFFYKLNDVVKYGGINYICTLSHFSAASFDPAKWSIYVPGFNWVSAGYTNGGTYKLNDIVKYGPSLYICTSASPFTSSTDTIDLTKFSLFVAGLDYESSWNSATAYQPGDTVSYGGYTYTANLSNTNKVPSTNTSEWTVFTTGYSSAGVWSSSTAYKIGSVINYGGNAYVALQDNTNAAPAAAGDSNWSLLIKGFNFIDAGWINGTTYYPGDTVRYASSTYRAKISHVGNNSTTRPDLDVGATYWALVAAGDSNSVLSARGDILTRSALTNVALPIGGAGARLISDGTDPYWGFDTGTTNVLWVSPSGTDDTSTGRGSSRERAYRTVQYAATRALALGGTGTIRVLTGQYTELLPIKVPANWAISGEDLRSTRIGPDTTTDKGYGVGISKDGVTPNVNATMFLMNNGTSLRNATLQNLTGTATAADAYGLTRVTGGVYIALDPAGSITSKSPYIQNVSTFGTRAVGMKIDGSVQTGGYATMVANDFTQVIDQGIGVWCLGAGKAELVSVFTYYAHIGYLADSGAKIRATNGNNSYGDYGSLASGYDASETPYTATVNNRNNQARVGRVLISNGQVKRIEQQYPGESYSSATISFSGTGSTATATPTFVNNGVKYIAPTTGGVGHKIQSGYAQTGTTTSITLSSSETAATSSYNGMRITITDGTGSGQTGIISTYNAGTKVATVTTEAGSAGWDLFGGVTAPVSAASALDPTTKYEIEPRVQVVGGSFSNQAFARAVVQNGTIVAYYITDSGSGYGSTPTITITDPNASVLATGTPALGSGVIRYWTISGAGTGWIQTSATATISGNGYAEILPTGSYVYVSNYSALPIAGNSFQFANDAVTNYYIVSVTDAGSGNATLRVYPNITTANSPAHSTVATFRKLYSNVRLTGHDFLNIGTGGIATTNYPGTPSINPDVTKQTVNQNLGRVFFTSTDQDGNFNVGNLFVVQQATGTATLSSQYFDLAGLSSITLTPLSGFSSTINEFSNDSTFTGASANKVATQSAVKTYVDTQLGGGKNSVVVNTATISNILIGNGSITTTDSGAISLSTTKLQASYVPSINTDLTPKTYVDQFDADNLQIISINTDNNITGSSATSTTSSLTSGLYTNYNAGSQTVSIDPTVNTGFLSHMLVNNAVSVSINTNGRLILTYNP